MLPASQNFSTSTNAGFPNFENINYPTNSQGYLPASQDRSLHQGADPNSPELFHQNLQLVRQNVAELQNLARGVLNGIQNAYHTGISSAETEGGIAQLRHSLENISQLMRHSGVGALPVLPMPTADGLPIDIPDDEKLMAETNQDLQILYEKLKRRQDSAAVVANLLGAEQTSRTGR